MANTRSDVAIANGSWIDLYAGSGIAVGTAVSVLNKGSMPVYVCVAATSPTVPTTGAPKGVPLFPAGVSSSVSISASASGLWAWCDSVKGSIVLVQD